MRNGLRVIAFIITLSAWGQNALAGTTTLSQYWPEGNGGGLASNCIYTVSNLQPLSNARTIIADNSIDNGTVLYSWDYNDFGFINLNCPTGTTLTTVSKDTVPIVRSGIQIYYSGILTNLPAYGPYVRTNNSGIGIRLYFKVTEKNEYASGYGSGNSFLTSVFNADGGIPMPVGVEYSLNNNSSHIMYTILSSSVTGNAGAYKHTFSSAKNNHTYSVRGEVIKIGDINTSATLAPHSSGYLRLAGSGIFGTTVPNVLYSELFGSGGITFVKPSCRLKGGTDYTVELGRWIDRGGNNAGSLPVTGPAQQMGINLECNGVANVDFNFQDTGTTASSNSNVSVYDSQGGQLIEGLEIEMLYNNSRINVRKPSENVIDGKIDVGVHGSYNGTPTNPNNFNSQSQVQFGARFVQRSAIKRNGVSYTGPVTGKVNMFVTYH